MARKRGSIVNPFTGRVASRATVNQYLKREGVTRTVSKTDTVGRKVEQYVVEKKGRSAEEIRDLLAKLGQVIERTLPKRSAKFREEKGKPDVQLVPFGPGSGSGGGSGVSGSPATAGSSGGGGGGSGGGAGAGGDGKSSDEEGLFLDGEWDPHSYELDEFFDVAADEEQFDAYWNVDRDDVEEITFNARG